MDPDFQKIREELQAYYKKINHPRGEGLREFHAWLKQTHRHRGMSTGNINKMINFLRHRKQLEGNPSWKWYARFKLLAEEYFNINPNPSHQIAFASYSMNASSSDPFRFFLNQSWKIYLHDIDPMDDKSPYIWQSILHIYADGAARIYAGNGEPNFEGKLESLDNNIVSIHLKKAIGGDSISLKFKVRNDQPREISIGAYVRQEISAIKAGTIILNWLKEPADELLVEKKLSFHLSYKNPEQFLEVPNPIREFLTLKNLNYIKTPSKPIFSLNDLGSFVNKYKPKPETFFVENVKPIVFISAPIYSVDEATHSRYKEKILELKSQLEEVFPQFSFLYKGDERVSNPMGSNYKDITYSLKRTNFFILIFPEPTTKRPSLSFVELGWAYVFCKEVIIFSNDEWLPRKLPNYWEKKSGRKVASHLNWDGKNFHFIFENISQHFIEWLKHK